MNNLKPFDLQAALSGKAVMLRDGEKAFVRHHESELAVSDGARLIGFLADGKLLTWYEGGNYNRTGHKSFHDIIGMYPETRAINGFEVPAPETEAPDCGTNYYLASPVKRYFHSFEFWCGDPQDKLWLKRDLVFLNKEDAIATAKAMLGIDPYEGDE